MTIRVVLGDDNVLVREGVRALLGAAEGVEVVGVAEDGPTLLAAAAEHRPDVVVTDIKMPPYFRLEGIEAAHEIRRRLPGTGVVVLSAHDDEAYALALLGRGDRGLAYLLKDRLGQGDELERAIREVASGGSMVDPKIASALSGRDEHAEANQTLLDLMAQGLGYAEMAAQLETTPEAVDRMVTELFRRLAAGAGAGENQAVDEIKRLRAAAESARALRSLVPTGVAGRLAAGSPIDHIDEEVEATVLFSDVRGFSSLAERLPARELGNLLAVHLPAMAEVVADHAGSVEKFAGDGVMAVFGIDEPREGHAVRALRCALGMQVRQAELNAEAAARGLPPLEIGVGVNTGTVVTRTIGRARQEVAVLGDAVNLAQRLQSVAGPGEIFASAASVASAAEAEGMVAVPIGPRTVKGRSEPVDVYQIESNPP